MTWIWNHKITEEQEVLGIISQPIILIAEKLGHPRLRRGAPLPVFSLTPPLPLRQ